MTKINYDYIEKYLDDLNDDYSLNVLRMKAIENKVPIIRRSSLKFLETIIKIKNPKNILELGTAIGYSTICLRKVANCKITSIELSKKNYNQALNNIEKYDYDNLKLYNLINCDAIKALKTINQGFDFVFIDCDKSHYKEYFNECDRLLKNGGIIVCDNILFNGQVASDDLVKKRDITIVKRLREFLVYLENLENYTTTFVPIGDGISISIKEF